MPLSKTRWPFDPVSTRPLVHRMLRVASATVSLGAMLGCQGIVSSPVMSQARVIVTSPDAPGLDMYLNAAPLVYNLGFGTITSYVPLDAGIYTVFAKSAGTAQVMSSAKGTFVSSAQYTVLVGNVSASLTETILKDQSQAAPSGQVALRFIGEATRVGGLDIYLVPAGQKITAVTPLITNFNFSGNTGYLNVPTGAYTLVLVPTGTVPNSTTVATYTGAQVTYSAGCARTIVLIDQQLVNTPGLQVITAADYDSPTATS
ncbi:DUF4397 domain-containing protein [Granulicella sp. dw_53]|uniref:DUF4397 domain-containing protein n=1 Tax=Granulicella sp. dw_53 TaxID=2719792 RepID=UPI001BD3BD51|nr:DUF4397 domain-containing protein [Granulicella sp. dw_53]